MIFKPYENEEQKYSLTYLDYETFSHGWVIEFSSFTWENIYNVKIIILIISYTKKVEII